MNRRLHETIEKYLQDDQIRGGQDVLFVDAYDRCYRSDIAGTITCGINSRREHFIIEYENQETESPK